MKQKTVEVNNRVTISPAEASLMLGISRPVIYRLMVQESNPLPSFKIGTRTLISVDSLRSWVSQQERSVSNND